MILSSSVMAAGQKIGVVNFQEVMRKIPQSAAISSALEAEFKDERAALQKLEEDIKYNQEKLKRDGALMAAKEKKALEQKIADMFKEYQQRGQAFKQKATQRQNEETSKIIALIRQSVDNIAAKGNYDLVVEQNAVVYVKPDNTITDEVIKAVSKLN